MICKKCETRINLGTKCFQCGYDSDELIPSLPVTEKKYKRSPILVASMLIFIGIGVIIILSRIGFVLHIIPLINITIIFPGVFRVPIITPFVAVSGIPGIIRDLITIAVAFLDIVLCIFILKLNKRAFKVYVWLVVIGVVLQLVNWISSPIMIVGILVPYLLKGLLLLLIHNVDGKHFGGGAFLFAPISVKLARKKQDVEKKSIFVLHLYSCMLCN